jgi:DNA end-binding protein Ku
MRAIWKGAIAFGLVSIPVRVFAATEQRTVSFVQVRRSDGSRIRYRRVAEADGAEVAYSDIAKGYPLASGEVVVLEDAELAELPLRTSREVEVVAFVPVAEIDPILYAKPYYLEPDPLGLKPYVLLREVLRRSERVALVKVALRGRESLAVIRVRDDVLVLHTTLWPDEVREPAFEVLGTAVEPAEAEVAMAETLVAAMSGDFDPSQHTDHYREAVEALIQAKVDGMETVTPPEAGESSEAVVDLMAALRASVEAARREAG